MTDFKSGEIVWTLTNKGEFQERRVSKHIFPYHVDTELLDGEPTQNPKTGMFICSKSYLKLEVGLTKEEMLRNRIELENQRIARAQEDIAKANKRIRKYTKKLGIVLKVS